MTKHLENLPKVQKYRADLTQSNRLTRSKRSRSDVVDNELPSDKVHNPKTRKLSAKGVPAAKNKEKTKSTPKKKDKASCQDKFLAEATQNELSTESSQQHKDDPIVYSAKSLINSVKNGKLGVRKVAQPQKVNNFSEEVTAAANRNLVSGIQAEVRGDGVDVHINPSDDDYSGPGSSSDDESDINSMDGGSSSESGEILGENESTDDTDYESEEEQLDRNDPRVKKLLEQLKREEEEKKLKKRAVKQKKSDAEGGHKPSNAFKTPVQFACNSKKSITKSPSDTTLYAPALNKEICTLSNVSQRLMHTEELNPQIAGNLHTHLSNFTEHRHRSSDRGSSGRDRTPAYSPKAPRSADQGREDPSREGHRTSAEKLVIEAERFKAAISNPKGKQQTSEIISSPVRNVIDGNNLSDSINELISLLRDKSVSNVTDNDDDFMHVTCHIDGVLRAKIGKGEFIELERLLPRTRSQIMGENSSSEIEVIKKDGSTFRLPDGGSSRETKIYNVRRWEQAFRVYAAVYSEQNPHRSAEIWQYVHIINTAAVSYAWENVAFYDYTFRQLMERKPNRSWAKIYTQMWNLAMTDHINKSNQGQYSGGGNNSSYNQSSGSGGGNNPRKHGDWRDRCCWRFNKNKCSKWNCKFDHRVQYKGMWILFPSSLPV